MITHIGIRFCSLDEWPVDTSEAYQLLRDLHGPDVADFFTYEKEIELPKGVFHDPLPDRL